MIGRLRGIILEKQPPLVLLETNGVGYEVQLPMTCFYELPELGQEAIIFTQFVVREDAQLLYGFNNKQERALFRELIKVNGVGPKLALAILSGMSAIIPVISRYQRLRHKPRMLISKRKPLLHWSRWVINHKRPAV